MERGSCLARACVGDPTCLPSQLAHPGNARPQAQPREGPDGGGAPAAVPPARADGAVHLPAIATPQKQQAR
eukprot:scaffold583221_cov26-Prasinocladus_malaysianus.AAC.1